MKTKLQRAKLALINQKMQECIDVGDTEIAHGIADDLLCEALTLLCCDDIVDIYKKVEKWYA